MRSRHRLPLSLAATLLAAAGLFVAPAGPARAAITSPPLRFSDAPSGAWFAWSSPAIGDITGDGQNDVVAGGQDSHLYAYGSNGARLWRSKASGAIASSPAIGDLDGDGRNEVAVGTGSLDGEAVDRAVGAINIFNGNGLLRCQKFMGTKEGSAVYGAPAIGDVNGDGHNDVVFGSFDHWIYVLDGNCNMIAGKDNRDSVFSTPALYDVDGDGRMEIFIGGDATRNNAVPESFAGGVFRALRYDGSPTLAERWQRRSTETFQSGAAIGDIDGDRRLEVVTGAGAFYCRYQNICSDSSKVWAFHLDDGTSPAGWPKTASLNTTFNAAPALGDLDGDGIVDVVIGTNNYSPAAGPASPGSPNGGAVNAFYSKDGTRRVHSAGTDVQLIGSPVIADLDGTPGNEVVVSYNQQIWILDESLSDTTIKLQEPPLNHLAAVAVGEVGKGQWSLVTTGFADGSRNGSVRVYSIPTPTSAPWPMLSKNARHLGTDATAAVPIVCTGGYRLVAADGGVFAYGDSAYHGSTGGVPLARPIVGMAQTPTGAGYWLVASDGGIFSFGDAKFYGSTGATRLNQPIVGMASTPGGKGYWLVASDGGIFAFGDAKFYGSTGAVRLNKPIVGMAATSSGDGYWFVASDGGVFGFGGAKFYGSAGSAGLTQPVVGMRATPSGKGYRFVARDGGMFNYGDATFCGSTGGRKLTSPIVALS